jgi:hypothetical protein
MAIPEDHLEALRGRISATIQRGTNLFADLTSLDEWLQTLIPALGRMTERERQTFVAKLCGYDPALPEHLQQLIQGLADLLGGLTVADGGQAWLRQHLARVETGDDEEAA